MNLLSILCVLVLKFDCFVCCFYEFVVDFCFLRYIYIYILVSGDFLAVFVLLQSSETRVSCFEPFEPTKADLKTMSLTKQNRENQSRSRICESKKNQTKGHGQATAYIYKNQFTEQNSHKANKESEETCTRKPQTDSVKQETSCRQLVALLHDDNKNKSHKHCQALHAIKHITTTKKKNLEEKSITKQKYMTISFFEHLILPKHKSPPPKKKKKKSPNKPQNTHKKNNKLQKQKNIVFKKNKSRPQWHIYLDVVALQLTTVQGGHGILRDGCAFGGLKSKGKGKSTGFYKQTLRVQTPP